jgi:hypothetical protein
MRTDEEFERVLAAFNREYDRAERTEKERDEARGALVWVWDHFDCRAFQSDGYHGEPVPDWIVELVQVLWAARAAAEDKKP